ncbi:MAG: FAD:protein FMN transferase, partial [Parachlamydiaceae bacterium]|nr:FAD:protein FMN transferase [Parachlamydiaceae bacterium]
CVDRLVENLSKKGFTDVYVEWGGEIHCQGQHPEKRPWTVFVSRLGNTDPSQAIAVLAINNSSIATSGDYLQNWTINSHVSLLNENNATTFFHIFDPKTLRPLESSLTSIASASVTAPSCAFADGLATTAMMFPTLGEAEVWANTIKEKYPEISFWLVNRQSEF